MAEFMIWFEKLKSTRLGRLALVLVYAAMIALILVFFDGNGEFIYEGF
ncbi:MAG: hypothetical protein RR314_05310 [Oscillospiraceae bacterium]